MKRNETILVYAVTVMLLVILLVAVVFGESKPANASNKSGNEKQMAGLPGTEFVDPVGKKEQADPAKTDGTEAGQKTPKAGSPAGKGTGETVDTKGHNPIIDTEPVDPKKDPINKKAGPVDLSAVVVPAAKQIEQLLGTSTKMGAEYRKVKGRRGDTLRKIVARWCGDATTHLADVEALNETLIDRTCTGKEEVVVPWVDDEVLLAAMKQPAAPEKKAKQPVVVSSNSKLYTLKKGDSLWALAKSRVGENRFVPAWIERFKQLNPEITDPSVLVAGQRVKVPK